MQIAPINLANLSQNTQIKQNASAKNVNVTQSNATPLNEIPSLAFSSINFRGETKPLEVKIGNCVDLSAFSLVGKNAVKDIAHRAEHEGQFLNWIGALPREQLKNLDRIYDEIAEIKDIDTSYDWAQFLKNAKTEEEIDECIEKIKTSEPKLVVIGIGGSRNPAEFIVNALGYGKNVQFYSSVEPDSFNRLMESVDLDTTKFMIVSKSGTTLEPSKGYADVKEALQKHLGRTDVSDRLIAITDKSNKSSKLRQAADKGEFCMTGLVHDDVGGRFSIFDDETIYTLAYLGMPKEDVKAMLEASLDAQKEYFNTNIKENDALKLAAFNVANARAGRKNHYCEYFGDAFNKAINWEKQLKNESLKSKISTDVNVGPAFLHYNAEGDLDDGNDYSFFTFVNTACDDKVTNAILAAKNSYAKFHHGATSEIILKDYSPKTLARFIELKHFETLYTGYIYRFLCYDKTPSDKPLPEVIQPNVEKYKKDVNAAMNA